MRLSCFFLFFLFFLPTICSGKEWVDPATGLVFVAIQGGCFEMGDESEKPIHEVCVDGFWLSKYEVSNKEWRYYMPNHNSGQYKGHALNGDAQPVVMVSWDDAKAYAKWLSQKSKAGFRLPTEAEWEFAARAGSQLVHYWKEKNDSICASENVSDKSAKSYHMKSFNCDDGHAATSPVGSFSANSWGIYDMLGNVREWCEDGHEYSHKAYANHSRNNPVIKEGEYKVIRGGSYQDTGAIRATCRDGYHRDLKQNAVGFRLVAY